MSHPAAFALPLCLSLFTLPILTFPMRANAEVAGMPLREGYYTQAGESCAEGSDATLLYLHQGGFNNSFGMCSFDAVTPEAEGRFGYAATCTDPEEQMETPNEGRITLHDADHFRIYDGLMDLEYSYCPPSELPPPYGTP